jgi:membrane-associated protein
MNLVRFLSFDIFGVTGWVVMMTMLGYSLGNVAWVLHNFEKVVIGIIAVSLLPAAIEVLKSRKK